MASVDQHRTRLSVFCSALWLASTARPSRRVLSFLITDLLSAHSALTRLANPHTLSTSEAGLTRPGPATKPKVHSASLL